MIGEIISIYPVMEQIKLYLEIIKEHFLGA